MSQNLVNLKLSDESLSAIDMALDTLDKELSGLVTLLPSQRRQLTKMGDKSEAFCRAALDIFKRQPDVLARNFDLEGFAQDMAALEALRPRMLRLTVHLERATDTEMALGSDLMNCALDGYAFLKVAGKGEGLDALRKMLSARFNRSRATQRSQEQGS